MNRPSTINASAISTTTQTGNPVKGSVPWPIAPVAPSTPPAASDRRAGRSAARVRDLRRGGGGAAVPLGRVRLGRSLGGCGSARSRRTSRSSRCRRPSCTSWACCPARSRSSAWRPPQRRRSGRRCRRRKPASRPRPESWPSPSSPGPARLRSCRGPRPSSRSRSRCPREPRRNGRATHMDTGYKDYFPGSTPGVGRRTPVPGPKRCGFGARRRPRR
jgi:hypothetical protein